MALRNPYMIKTVIGDDDLILEAKAGTSLLVKDIGIYNPANNYIEVSIERESVGYFRVGGSLGNHLSIVNNPLTHSHGLRTDPTDQSITPTYHLIVNADGGSIPPYFVDVSGAERKQRNALQYDYTPRKVKSSVIGLAREKGWFTGFPVGEGEKFSITGAAQSDAIQFVIYEEYDAGDMTPEMPNGSRAKENTYFLYGYPSKDVDSAGDVEIDTNRNPRPYPKFPFTDKVPANVEIDLLAILGSEVADWISFSDYVRTRYLKLWYEEEVLFDSDKKGLLYYGIGQGVFPGNDIAIGYSVVGNYSDVDGREPFIFPAPKTFRSGEQLVTQINIETSPTVTLTKITNTNLEICYIVKYRKVA